jgi:hypothetical protein|tara:strand:+ start:2498 stop:2848 length:351 start_codon:yes stop_codon:yes gene_type:complete
MLRYLMSLYKAYKQKKIDRVESRLIYDLSLLALRTYKGGLIEAYDLAGPQRRKLILFKIKAGTIWSKRQYNKILAKILISRLDLTYEKCVAVLDYVYLRNDFTYWSKKFFLMHRPT